MNSVRPRLLITARDPGAAANMREIARVALQRGDFEVFIAAQPPAAEILATAGLPVEALPPFAATGTHDPRCAALLETADALLARTCPDVVLVGLSGPDAGIDEALLLRARVPTFALQDYWGDVNLSLGRPAGTYLVMDEQAVALSKTRFGVTAMAVGAPKYAAYARLDPPRMRHELRTALGAEGKTLVVWYGQPLWQHAAYAEILAEFGRAVATALPHALLRYRSHPKETPSDVAAALDLLAQGGLPAEQATGRTTEAWMAASDVVASVFSSCGLDNIHLIRQSTAPLGITLYALSTQAIATLYREYTGLADPPPSAAGWASAAHSADELVACLRNALAANARLSAGIQSRLPAAIHAADKVLTQLSTAVRRQECGT